MTVEVRERSKPEGRSGGELVVVYEESEETIEDEHNDDVRFVDDI